MRQQYRISLIWIIANIFLVFTSCTKNVTKNEPNNRLEEYISKTFNVKRAEDKAGLDSFLTGKARALFLGWSEQQFSDAYIDSKRKFILLRIKETKKITEQEVLITYELSYLDQSKGHNSRVTNKKIVQMIFENSNWMISEVTNVKEMIEYSNEMTLP